MELRKRKSNISYKIKLKLTQDEDNTYIPQSITHKKNKGKKPNSDSEYEYTSNNESNDNKEEFSSEESKQSSIRSRKSKNKKVEIPNLDGDDDLKKDIIPYSGFDPIIQQNATITTPLRIIKKIKFNNIMNEIEDLVGDSDEEIETITKVDYSDIDNEIFKLKANNFYNNYDNCNTENQKKKETEGETNDPILIDIISIDDNEDKSKSGTSVLKQNNQIEHETINNNPNIRKSSENIIEKIEQSNFKIKSKRNYNDNNSSSSDDSIDMNITNKFKKQKRNVILDFEKDEDIDNKQDVDKSYTKNESNNNDKNNIIDDLNADKKGHNKNKNNFKKNDKIDTEYIFDDIEDNDNDEFVFKPHVKENNTKKINSDSDIQEKIKINSENLKIQNPKSPNNDNNNISITNGSEIINTDEHNTESIEISSDEYENNASDNIIIEIISHQNNEDQIEISDDGDDDDYNDDDDSYEYNKRKKSIDSLPQSSMKNSIEQRLSRKKKKNENRMLAFQRLKERKRKPIDSINPFEDVLGNEDDDSSDDKISPIRYFPDKNDDFIVSDSDSEPVYILTTEWDVKQRKKLYKSFKIFYRFCIGILIDENYIKQKISEIKKAYQIINKRINYVCKKITPVPPWQSKFQNSIDLYPKLSSTSQYPKSRCDSCHKPITSSFLVTFLGNRYNKLSLKEIKDDKSKDKKEEYVIDRVCLERAQIYHELYHFKFHTLKKIEKKIKESGMKISELSMSNDKEKVENTFLKLKVHCKELYVNLSDKLKKGESYVPNILDI